jgi:hypothetical protein
MKDSSFRLPIGTEDYREIRATCHIYINKTKIIENIIDCNDKALLILRPRRMGKSVNLSTLKYFF